VPRAARPLPRAGRFAFHFSSVSLCGTEKEQ
jgi:hypothetical protein